jgi:hypothetical protein
MDQIHYMARHFHMLHNEPNLPLFSLSSKKQLVRLNSLDIFISHTAKSTTQLLIRLNHERKETDF